MSTSAVPVKTAAEAGVERFADSDEMPNDEYFLRNFRSEIHPRASEELANQIYYYGQYITIDAARARERENYLTRAKERWLENHEREKAGRAQAEERRREQAAFEADAAEARAQARLAEALSIYQHTLGELVELNAQIDATRKEHAQTSHDNRLQVDKLASTLGKLSDLIGALQIRASQLDETAKEQLEQLRDAYGRAQREFAFLHQKERKVHLERAIRQLEAHFVLSETWKPEIAERASDLLNLDTASGYSGHRYDWPHETIMRQPLSSDQLIDAAKQLAIRFHAFRKTQQLYSSHIKS